MTDRPRIVLGISGEMELGRSREEPNLYLRCFQGRLEAYINVGSFVGTRDTFETRLRFDRSEPISQRWSSSTSGQAVFSQDPRGFTDRLARSERLLAEVTAFSGERYRMLFDLVGIADVLPEIETCRRPPQQPTQPRPTGQR